MNQDSFIKDKKSNSVINIILKIGIFALAFIIVTAISSGSIGSRRKNVEAAEKYANHQVYLSLGVTIRIRVRRRFRHGRNPTLGFSYLRSR